MSGADRMVARMEWTRQQLHCDAVADFELTQPSPAELRRRFELHEREVKEGKRKAQEETQFLLTRVCFDQKEQRHLF